MELFALARRQRVASPSLSMAGASGKASSIPGNLLMPLSLHTYTRFGSSMSILGTMRLGASMSVLDFASFGSSLSLRSFARLGASVSVFDFAKMGASLSLRSFATIGAALSVVGIVRLGSTLSVFDSMQLSPGKAIRWPGWSVSYNVAGQKFAFTPDGGASPISITPTGGSLHGTWTTESILSSSDERLKRDVRPLHRTLLDRLRTSPASGDFGAAGGAPPEAGVASWVLRALKPQRWAEEPSTPGSQTRFRFGFDASETEKVAPGVVWETSNKLEQDSSQKLINYQDLIALVVLAAQERQRQLDAAELREAEEEAQLEAQDALMEQMEAQLGSLRKRFKRLRRLTTSGPRT
eukprot:TRINITY_DN6723_c4_g1_i3.p1 TRINITY_DN6723_c4_g1~~TRINITY_DN6723_c4_g1_i3.p1  ORF type:complete len:352 (+),score=51.27 TRINITY_DN6723_c4_g1_i3:43-1098(+)